MVKIIIIFTFLFLIKHSLHVATIDSLLDSFKTITNTIDNSIQSLVNGSEQKTSNQSLDIKQLEKRKKIYDEFTINSLHISSVISVLKGIADKNYERFVESFLKRITIEGKDSLKEDLKAIQESEENDWKCIDIVYNNKETNHIKFLSIFGNHEGGKSNIYYMQYESTVIFDQDSKNTNKDSDLLAVSHSSTIKPETSIEYKSIPESMDKDDILMLLALARKKAMKDFMNEYDTSKKTDM